MAGRSIAIGDIHGDLDALKALFSRLPALEQDDTLIFLGDYIDSGHDSAGVVSFLRADLPGQTPAKIVTLRGNHEDAWIKVIDEGWPGFVMPPGNGCHATFKSFRGIDMDAAFPTEEITALFEGSFFPEDVVAWMRGLETWYEDEHAVYVHAGLQQVDGEWLHPANTPDTKALLWQRKEAFFLEYGGKPVVCGHTGTNTLPAEHDRHTPDDPNDVFWAGRSTYAIDTRAGKGGFLSAIEFPGCRIHESPRPPPAE